jgi:anti-sigma regulatory factor (Ser/Thr protein kinase)
MLIHEALFYDDPAEYAESVGAFVDAGHDTDEPVMVAVPGANLELLRARPGTRGSVQFADMAELGRNPARIIPRIRAFVDEHRDRHVRFVGEPIWAGRTASETIVGTRHEALINLAFADSNATILCPYDTVNLDSDVLEDATCTHPILVAGDQRTSSASFIDPVVVYAAAAWPLTEPPTSVVTVAIGADLGEIRASVRQEAAGTGLSQARADDLLLATNEVVTNTLVHAGSPGELRIWRDGGEVICEIADGGEIHDPLVGRVEPGMFQTSGRGLWLANQLCDLVELRSGSGGTIVRLHMTLN